MSKERLPLPVLMLVTDRVVAGDAVALVIKVAEAVEGGVNVVQLRVRDLPHDELMSLARRLREVIGGRALLVVNSSPEVALGARADGVHLPEDAPTPREWPHSLLIGRSVHSVAAAQRAEVDGADYVVFGPVYETESHAGAAPAGLAALWEVADAISIPVVAIGGVTAERARDVLAAGASGVAVIRAILAADETKAAAEALRSSLNTASASR